MVNEGYLGNHLVKRDGIVQDWNKEQISEYYNCMKDPVYFAENYAKIISLDKGLVPFELYPYQKEMFNHFNKNRFSIILACRQSGKSISSVIYLLWYAIFHPEKTIIILANKNAISMEMLARITLALENLPFFLQPGTKVLNKGSIEFSNNSRIIAAATSSSSVRGMSVNLLFLDEFAFVERASEFYTSTYPVISSGKTTKVIITSTANGVGNVFHRLWEGAVQGTNEFKSFTVNWWDVPGRDEEWKKQTISNTSQLQFNQEYGNSFIGSGDTLISPDTLLTLRTKEPVYTQGNVKVYTKPEKDHVYIMTVDVAQGRGLDYTTFTIIDVSTEPFEQVVVYRDNKISPLLVADVVYKYAKTYNEAYVIIESNDQGVVVCNDLYYELEYENMYTESTVKADSIGLKMTKKTKRLGCSYIKDLIEQNKLEIIDADSIIELSTFVARGISYEASDSNNDDLVMNLVLFGWFTATSIFQDIVGQGIKDIIYEEKIRQMEESVLPFGFIDDGLGEEQYESFIKPYYEVI